jgi:hypothetical protein
MRGPKRTSDHVFMSAHPHKKTETEVNREQSAEQQATPIAFYQNKARHAHTYAAYFELRVFKSKTTCLALSP